MKRNVLQSSPSVALLPLDRQSSLTRASSVKRRRVKRPFSSFAGSPCPNPPAARLRSACGTRLLPPLLLLLVLPSAVQAQFIFATKNGAITITECIGSGGTVTPGTINSLPVTSIRNLAFDSRNLASLTIPNNATSIGRRAKGIP